MKTLVLFIAVSFALPSAFAEQKTYDSYNDIVDKLSAQRNQSVKTKMSTTMPDGEHFQLSFGLTNSSTSIEHAGVGNVSQNGFLFGAAVPLIGNELFAEGFAKFFKSANEGDTSTSLRQFELRLSHKEPLTFAVWNVGLGASMRLIEVQALVGNESFSTPSLLLTSGLERRLTERISLAGDLGYHRSLQNDNNGRNSFEFIVRMNYHL